MDTLIKTLNAFTIGSCVASGFGVFCMFFVLSQGGPAAAHNAAQIMVLVMAGLFIALFFAMSAFYFKDTSGR